jgi:phosphoribosyl-ATP pyrophosphohydrolase/phosphoribosyl-AMP cyclohydrolase/histidinol dehydrogenase
MTRTCWGPVHGVQKLEAILLDRKKSAPEGSYTKRLFDDPDLLQKKLLEEVISSTRRKWICCMFVYYVFVLCSLTLPLPLPRLTCTVYIDASRKPL